MKKSSPFSPGDKVNFEMLKRGGDVAEIPAVIDSISRPGFASIILARKTGGNVEAVSRVVPVNSIKKRGSKCSHEDTLTM
jgi:hypothetical protein